MSRRFRAPKGDGEILADPPFAAVEELARRNRELLDTAEVEIDGTPLREFRRLTRQEVLGFAPPFPGGRGVVGEGGGESNSPSPPTPGEGGTSNGQSIFVTGHQPELFHPGVWAKNFALHGLARRLNGVPLNLIVDNDTLKSAHLLAPVWDADPAKVRLEKQPFDDFAGEVPWELTKWATEFSARRIATEHRWGCENRELRVSTLSQATAFRRFAAHITANRPRFRTAYNRAVAEYRTARGIKSKSHPVPDLAENELPFWEFADTGRVRATPATPPERLRPRALTLTLFVRLCLADWFIHGIGGAKYDEVTDAVLRDFFGLEPPAFQVVTGTLHLPIPGFPRTQRDVAELEAKLRRLHWNPEGFLPTDHPARLEKAALTASKPNGRPAVRRWFARIRELTAETRAAVATQVTETERDLANARAEAAANAILRRRDFAWVLYPEDTLRPFLQQFLTV